MYFIKLKYSTPTQRRKNRVGFMRHGRAASSPLSLNGAAAGRERSQRARSRRSVQRPRTTILALTLGVGQMGEVMPAATAIFCPTPVSYLITPPPMAPPRSFDHNFRPLAASKAYRFPPMSPNSTNRPLVGVTPPISGKGAWNCHLRSPVSALLAVIQPDHIFGSSCLPNP